MIMLMPKHLGWENNKNFDICLYREDLKCKNAEVQEHYAILPLLCSHPEHRGLKCESPHFQSEPSFGSSLPLFTFFLSRSF